MDVAFMRDYKDQSSEENILMRSPVILCNTYNGNGTKFIPNLSMFGIPKLIDAHTMYEDIYNFLGWLVDNPQPPDNQTDKDKIVSHGFDLKHSFRPLIKN